MLITRKKKCLHAQLVQLHRSSKMTHYSKHKEDFASLNRVQTFEIRAKIFKEKQITRKRMQPLSNAREIAAISIAPCGRK